MKKKTMGNRICKKRRRIRIAMKMGNRRKGAEYGGDSKNYN